VDEMRVTVIATGFYLNQEGRLEAPGEEDRHGHRRRLTIRDHVMARMQDETEGADPDREGEPAVEVLAGRDQLDTPAILRRKTG